jgi:hypothetical protein
VQLSDSLTARPFAVLSSRVKHSQASLSRAALVGALLSSIAVLGPIACAATGTSSADGAGGSTASGEEGLGGGFAGSTTSSGVLDPDAGCGYAKVMSAREPGRMMLVFDRSLSMTAAPDGTNPPGPGLSSKMSLAVDAMTSVLGALPDDLELGLVLFPQANDGCGVDVDPAVAVGPLQQTRSNILASLANPTGNTPTENALDEAYADIGGLGGSGKKAVLLITDGKWNCGSSDNSLYTKAASALSSRHVETFVIGVPGSDDTALSKLAHAGGSDRVNACLPDCAVDTLDSCCHYRADAQSFKADLIKALDAVALELTTTCIFAVPKGDPTKFDSNQVNVVVTLQGQMAEVVPQDPVGGWTYVAGGTDAIELHGSVCNDVLTQNATVEILLGCPTILK